MAAKNVSIYTTPTCGYCKQAKTYFNENDIEYQEFDVATDIERRQEMVQKTGQLGVPVIAVGDQMMVGFDQEKLGDLLTA